MILDAQVPTADPGELVEQYSPLVHKIANRYYRWVEKLPSVDMEDLLQAGKLAIFKCQSTYDPAGGASFLTYVFDWIRSAMYRTMGIRSDGTLPVIPESLDEPLDDESDATRLDLVPDTTPTAEERIVAQDAHDENREAVRAAVDRIKNERERNVIRRIWLEGKSQKEVAAEMGVTRSRVSNLDNTGRRRLRSDRALQDYAALQYPTMRVSKRDGQWTSATELAVLWRERHYDEMYGIGAFLAAGRHDLDIVQTSSTGA